jgi:hypothetical protein
MAIEKPATAREAKHGRARDEKEIPTSTNNNDI